MTLNETITHICLTVNLPVLGTPGTFNNNYRWDLFLVQTVTWNEE